MKTFVLSIVLYFLLLPFYGIGQVLPAILERDTVQEKITRLTADFDSVIFADIASYFIEDLKINGFGYKRNDIYKVTISFKNSPSYELSGLKCKKIIKRKKLDLIRSLNYSFIEELSSDSLAIRSRTDIQQRVSDASNWTVLIIKGKKSILKQSYAPEIYQKAAPTGEREKFMEIIKKILFILD